MGKAIGDFILGIAFIVAAIVMPFGGPAFLAALFASTGASFILRGVSALSAADLTGRQQALLVNTPNNQANLPVVYGNVIVGFLPVDYRVDPNSPDQTDLYLVGALCHGSQDGSGIEDINEVWIDQRLGVTAAHGIDPAFLNITRIVGGVTLSQWLTLTGLYKGTFTQTVDPTMLAKFPGAWDRSMKGQGIAYLVLKATFHENLYSGIPNVNTLVKGNHVFDPRDSTWKYSDNPALVIWDFLTSPIYGLGAATSELDSASFITAANYCDQTVTVNGVNYTPRYQCAGWLDTSRAPQDNLVQLLSSCRGQLIYEGGVFRLIIRDVASPVAFALTIDNIIGNFSFSTPGQADAYNRARMTFVPAPGPIVIDGGICAGFHAAGGIGDTTKNWAINQFTAAYSGLGYTYHLWITSGTGYDPTSTGYPITANGHADITATGCPVTDATTVYQITRDGTHSPNASTQTIQYPNTGVLLGRDFEDNVAGVGSTGSVTVTQDTAHAHSGTNAVKAVTGTTNNSGPYFTQEQGGRTPVNVGLSYQATLWIYGTGSAIGETFNLNLEWWTALSGGSFLSQAQTVFTVQAGWNQITVSGVAPATTVGATVSCYHQGTANVTVWIDDVLLMLFNGYLSDDQGYESTLDMGLPFTPNWWQALQIAQVLLKESRFGVACTLTARSEAIQLEVGDVVNVTHPTPGWSAKSFWVAGMALNEDLTVQLMLVEYQAAAYTLDGLQQPPIIPETNLPNPLQITPPTAVTLTSDATTLLQTDDGTVVPRVHVVWTPPTTPFLDYVEVTARLTGTNPWTYSAKVPIYESPQEAYLAGVQEGQTWDVWVRAVTVTSVKSDWVKNTIAVTSSLPDNLLPHVAGKEDAVLNGLFDDGGIAFWKPHDSFSAPYVSRSTSAPFTGSGCLKVHGDFSLGQAAYAEQALGVLSPGASGARTYVRINPGELWRFHAALKCSATMGHTAGALFGVSLWDGSKAAIGSIVYTGVGCFQQGNGWTEIDYLFTVPAGAYYMTPVCTAQPDPAEAAFDAFFDNLHIYRMKASNDLALQSVATGAKTVVLTNYPGSGAANSPPSKWIKAQADDGTMGLVPFYPT